MIQLKKNEDYKFTEENQPKPFADVDMIDVFRKIIEDLEGYEDQISDHEQYILNRQIDGFLENNRFYADIHFGGDENGNILRDKLRLCISDQTQEDIFDVDLGEVIKDFGKEYPNIVKSYLNGLLKELEELPCNAS